MKKEDLELIREWVVAEIEEAIGYHESHEHDFNNDNYKADDLFTDVVKALCPAPVVKKKLKKISPEDFEFMSEYKTEIVWLINRHRKKGATYKEIANMFNKAEFETFSGHGSWFAQTIHRLADDGNTPKKGKK